MADLRFFPRSEDMVTYSEEDFLCSVGQKPENDDLIRANCSDAGKPGHRQCGWCSAHDKPRFICGCRK